MIDFNAFTDELVKISANKYEKLLAAGKLGVKEMTRLVEEGGVKERQAVFDHLAEVGSAKPGPARELTKRLLHKAHLADKVRAAESAQKRSDDYHRQFGAAHRMYKRRLIREGFDPSAAERLAIDDVSRHRRLGARSPLEGLKGRLAKAKAERIEKARAASEAAKREAGQPGVNLADQQKAAIKEKVKSVTPEAKPTPVANTTTVPEAKPTPRMSTSAPSGNAPTDTANSAKGGMPTYAKVSLGTLATLGVAGGAAHLYNRSKQK